MSPEHLNILVVEDDPQDLDVIQRHLGRISDWRIVLHTASTNNQAIESVAATEFDLIILDYYLGEETSLDFIRMLRELDSWIPVIVITGRGDEDVAVAIFQAGAADYLPKGNLSDNSLRRSMRNTLEKAKLQHKIQQHRRHLTMVNKALKRRNREIQSFYHTLSHEVKTPLTSTREFLSIVLDGVAGPLTEKQTNYLKIAQEGCKEIAVHLNDLLDLTRMETGKLILNRSAVQIGEVVQKVVLSLQSAAAEKGVSLEALVEEDMRPVLADMVRITQVLNNLATNAIKFTEEGGQVRIRARMAPSGGDAVQLEVTDTGRGLKEEELGRIFDRLYQVQESDAATHQGLGLGLNIAQQLVVLHGGELKVVSEPGEGSTFSFKLPLAQMQNSPIPNTPPDSALSRS